MICEFDSNPPHELRVSASEEFPLPPLRVGVLVGEVCYNLRSAVDFLVYNLAWLDSGTPQEMTQFPIEDTRKGFAGRENTWLKGVNTAHVAEIEVLQPYSGCQWTKILRDLSNPDKHREFARLEGDFRATGFLDTHPTFAGIRSRVRRAKHPVHGLMDVKIELAASVEFLDELPIVETLEIVKLGIADALKSFERDFPAG